MQPLSRTEVHCSCKTLIPSILRSYRNMPIRSYYTHFTVHHDRPISVSSLDRRRGREKLRGGRSDDRSTRGGLHDLGYCPARLSEGFRQTGTFEVFPVVRRLSCKSCSWRGPISRSSADPPSTAMLLAEPRTIMLPRISPGPRNQDEYDMGCGKGETHQEAPNASPTCGTRGTARQKPGRVVVRHFCDWPLCCNEGRPCPRPLCLRSTLP
jgi:hypothetical protein